MASHKQNLLLGALPAETLGRLSGYLTIADVGVREVLYAAGQPITRVYFPLNGVVSMTTLVSGSIAEVATVGCEGLVGLPVFFGTTVAPLRTLLQVAGTVSYMTASDFTDLVRDDPALRSVMFRYTEAMFRQVGQSVVCNQRHTLRQRCARWLLLTDDRMSGAEFHLTHESLAAMLGVRRAGVTVAAGALQRAGLIRYRRGLITILDRQGLECVSCECYRVVQQAFHQLLGEPL
ncbi:MAG: Crp/Fnr family transcriptional regulator [Gemmatimonadaceae bacterium]